MQINNEEFRKILNHVRDQLLSQIAVVVPATGVTKYQFDAVSDTAIIGTLEKITLDSFLSAISEKKERRKKTAYEEMADGFESWWQAYPLTSNFSYKGMKFDKGTKTLRVDKEKCGRKYAQILREEGITKEQMLKALQVQVQNVKEECYQTGENSMRFFGMSSSYLNQGKYMGFIGIESETEEEEYNESSNCG